MPEGTEVKEHVTVLVDLSLCFIPHYIFCTTVLRSDFASTSPISINVSLLAAFARLLADADRSVLYPLSLPVCSRKALYGGNVTPLGCKASSDCSLRYRLPLNKTPCSLLCNQKPHSISMQFVLVFAARIRSVSHVDIVISPNLLHLTSDTPRTAILYLLSLLAN